MSMERLMGFEPDLDPEPRHRRTRRLPAEHVDDWQRAQDQYEAHLDRMGEAS